MKISNVVFIVLCNFYIAASEESGDIKFYNLEKEYRKTITHVYKVKNTNALEFKQIVKDMLSIYGVVHVNDKTNEIYITDVEEKINDIKPILTKLDNDSLKAGDNLVSKVIPLKFETASDMLVIVRHKLSPEGKIFVTPQLNALTVTDVPSKIEELTKLVEELDVPTKHVSIDITIIEFNSENFSKLGINVFNWLQDLTIAGQFHGATPPDIIRNASVLARSRQKVQNPLYVFNTRQEDINKPLHLGIDVNISDIANFICENAAGTVLANTRIVTKNNKEAFISAVERIALRDFEVDVSKAVPFDHFVEAGIFMSVVPSVQKDSLINLIITPRISDLIGWSPKGTPIVFDRALRTEVTVKDNSVFVLGGLKKKEKVVRRVGVPFLKEIPVLQYFFSVKKDILLQREVIMFIKPTTKFTPNAWDNQANKALNEANHQLEKR